MANINNHRLELIVNGVPIDLFESGVNLRLNNIINDPTKITFSQAEYSFSFNLPKTPTNSKVFNYANISSKLNKFSGRYNAEVLADGISIFQGTIKLTEIDEESFKCNLYKAKINTLETIFGESTMNEIIWKVPFKGTSTINEVNADETTKYFFPLVAYSLFNKLPNITTISGNRRYTSKYTIDNTNAFYFNTYVPSLNLVELLKKCCEVKGYTLQGDIISDQVLNAIYLSNYIADEQDPLYNYGDTDMGEVDLSVTWRNYNTTTSTFDSANVIEYPLQHIPITRENTIEGYNNYDTAFVWNTLQSVNSTITVNKNTSKMYVNGGVQVPADGWYEITMDMDIGIPTTQGDITANQCTFYMSSGSAIVNGEQVTWDESREYKDVVMNSALTEVDGKVSSFYDNFPIEIQLCRYDTDDGDVSNISHDIIFYGQYPNESDYLSSLNEDGILRVGRYSNINGGIGQLPIDGNPSAVAVDGYNNPDFVCGMSQSTYGRNYGYIKDGYSWHSDYQDIYNEALYNMNGYYYCYTDFTGGNIFTFTSGSTTSDVNQNTLVGATGYYPTANGRRTKGTVKMIVRLNRNDMLVPFAQTRGYYIDKGNSSSSDVQAVFYQADATINLKVRAAAPTSTGRNKLSYNMNSLFDKELNLGNFCNQEQKISEFFDNVQKTFNLSFEQDGKNIILNKNKQEKNITAPIDIDNKVNTSNAVFNEIEFPKSITVKWSIDTEEEGFYRSVEDNTTEEQMQSNNWKDYGDYGYQKVLVSPTDDATDLTQSLQFSYCWYRPFNVTMNNQSTVINVPVIGKTEWWIDGFKYEEMAKNDGRGFKQRFWFRGSQTRTQLLTNATEYYDITTCTNYKQFGNNVVYLNYNNGVNTLLGKYFNVDADAKSNEVEIEVYLTPKEYKEIANGASVHFDDDIYKVNEISGYDPSGDNPTTLKLMKC